MKKSLFITFLLATSMAWGGHLTLQDGTVYQNVIIVSADPERMLIVHDGGGCQVAYDDLVPDSLTAEQKEAVTDGLKAYAARELRREELRRKEEEQRLAREAFEAEQREKGLVEFEGHWMTPAERKELLALRELQKLEKEKAQAELARQKAELEKERLRLEQERARLAEYENSRNKSTYIYYGTYSPVRHYPHNRYGVSFHYGNHSSNRDCKPPRHPQRPYIKTPTYSITYNKGSVCK